MATIYIDGNSLTLKQIYTVAEKKAKVVLTEEAKIKIQKCRICVDNIIKENQVVYGVNTGFGAFKDKLIAPEKLKELQRNLIISHSTGVGNYLPVKVVRASMLLRIMLYFM